MNLWRGSACGGLLIALAAAWLGATVHGQQPAAATPVESDPLTCWWKTDKHAVRVGEPLTLALTCGVLETDDIRVVVDPARLDPAVLDMTPFEVVGGTRHADIPAPPRRYFQYSYTLRLLGAEFFGRDVDIPRLPLTYRVESTRIDAGQGRDHLYLLPPLPLRVMSLVPVTATDIRDAQAETFADIESRSWRTTWEFAAAGLLFACAAVFAGIAVHRAMRRPRGQQAVSAAMLPAGAVLRACEREVQRIKAEATAGWTHGLIGRALTVFRIASATALGRHVAQAVVKHSDRPDAGQLVVERGRWQPQRVLLSASTTGPAITAWLAGDARETDPRVRDALEDLAVPLQVFGAALYSRSGVLDPDALDSALEQGMRGLGRLRSTTRWRARAADALARTVAAFREMRWAR